MRLCILFALVIFASCADSASEERKNGYSDTPKNPEDSLFQDVMDLHDQAMAKMGKLAGYQKAFTSKIDSLNKVKSSARATLTKEYGDIRASLKQAEDKMNTWMHEFSIDTLQDDAKRRISYLESEKSKVIAVKDEILSVLSTADSALKK